jgi:putative ABC transport system substrate-binding protein
MGVAERIRRKRTCLVAAALVVAVLTPSFAGEAQPVGTGRRIGYLTVGPRQPDEELERALRDLGWIKGQNVVIEYRWAEGKYERLPALAHELVQLNVDVIVAPPTAAALAAHKATRSIPIVMIFVAEPVGLGLVQSLARPGGNVTGTTLWAGWEIFAKQLQLLKEVVPRATRVAVLWNPDNPPAHILLRSVATAARSMNIELQSQEARGPGEFDGAFRAMRQGHADGLLFIPDLAYLPYRIRLVELALASRLPTMLSTRWDMEAGGLMYYGASMVGMVHRAATHVDRILKGAKPAELPVEEPTKFELGINLRTAKALGLTIPRSLLVRADQIIQ